MLIYFIFHQNKRVRKLKAVSLSRDATSTINSFVTGSDDIMLTVSGKLLSLVRILKQVVGRLKRLVKHISSNCLTL